MVNSALFRLESDYSSHPSIGPGFRLDEPETTSISPSLGAKVTAFLEKNWIFWGT
jgi:hypothetical protein